MLAIFMAKFEVLEKKLDLFLGACWLAGHIPVLLEEIITELQPAFEGEAPQFLDCTFGRGGHTRALLEKFPNLKVFALDRDPEAVDFANEKLREYIEQKRFKILHHNFADFQFEKWGLFDGILMDLGVSSPQLDEGRRGFSFYHEGPLDMRMDPTQGPSAADLVNSLTEDELNSIFKNLGEIKSPYRVTRAVVHDRSDSPFLMTRQLASLIERVEGWHRKGFHPATQYFMALRLQVNQELESVSGGVQRLMHRLKPRGRMAVLTFHSLEDRIVKNLFRSAPEDLGHPVHKKVIQPRWEEQKNNPRARSAKLRVFERQG